MPTTANSAAVDRGDGHDVPAGESTPSLNRRSLLLLSLAAMLAGSEVLPIACFDRGAALAADPSEPGPIELEVRSEFSHIRLRRNGSVRTLSFVRDNGEEAWETQIDLARPHDLRFPYLRFMFLSYVLRPQQEKVLIVGLGGGSMIHFIRHFDRNLQVDAVEIDPAVVQIADRYFGVRGDDRVNIVTEDAFKFLSESETEYDVIYMDAFLKPSEATDSTGAPLNLRTRQFYESLRKNLKPDGLVAFNLNPHRGVREDLRGIREAFPQSYVFALPQAKGAVAIGTFSQQRLSREELLRRAALLDRQFRSGFSFQNMVRTLDRF